MTTLERNIEKSVTAAEDIRWFRGYLQGLLDSGKISRPELEVILRALYERFRDSGQERLADLMLDGLDLLTGWHGPDMGVRARKSA